jgi:hypothetical protein
MQMQGEVIAKITAIPEFAVALYELPPSAHLMWPMYWEVLNLSNSFNCEFLS